MSEKPYRLRFETAWEPYQNSRLATGYLWDSPFMTKDIGGIMEGAIVYSKENGPKLWKQVTCNGVIGWVWGYLDEPFGLEHPEKGKLYGLKKGQRIFKEPTYTFASQVTQLTEDSVVMFVEPHTESFWFKVIYQDYVGWVWGGIHKIYPQTEKEDSEIHSSHSTFSSRP